MIYTKQQVQQNIRNRDGKRVFYLGAEDRITQEAQDYLRDRGIEILSAMQAKPQYFVLENGATLEKKPESMTHLQGNVLVSKTHPRIAFRGALDELEGALLLCGKRLPHQAGKLQEILELARKILSCEVMDEPLQETPLCGYTQENLHHRSHFPQKYYNIAHFMPEMEDSLAVLELNGVRTVCRRAELMAAKAFENEKGLCTRQDLLQALNRMSSMLYVLMLEEKCRGSANGRKADSEGY